MRPDIWTAAGNEIDPSWSSAVFWASVTFMYGTFRAFKPEAPPPAEVEPQFFWACSRCGLQNDAAHRVCQRCAAQPH